MVAVTTGIFPGGGTLRYRALISHSVLPVICVTSVGSGASVDARQTSLADEVGRTSREYGVPRDLLLAMGYVRGGAAVLAGTRKPSDLGGWYEKRERQRA
jgi:hypothetical protein